MHDKTATLESRMSVPSKKPSPTYTPRNLSLGTPPSHCSKHTHHHQASSQESPTKSLVQHSLVDPWNYSSESTTKLLLSKLSKTNVIRILSIHRTLTHTLTLESKDHFHHKAVSPDSLLHFRLSIHEAAPTVRPNLLSMSECQFER